MQSVRSRTIILSMCVCVSFSALMRLLSYFHLHLFNVTHLTFLCYLTMVMLYIYDVTRRLIHKQVKTVLIVSGLMLFLWLCLRTIKYQLDPRYPTVIRYLWYAYYFCDLGIVTAIFSSILLVYRKASKDHLLIFGGLSLLGSLFVFTNDAHRLVFAFPNGLTHYETYTYAIGYYGIMAYIALLLVISLIVIVKEERMHAHKILYPLAFFLLKRAEYHVHISDMGVDECPLTDSEYKTEQPSDCFRLPSQQSSCCSRTEALSSIS